jgi:endonuclease YncB( thermonuclease family)
VARGPRPDSWIEVRLADFYAPELDTPAGQAAKAALSALTLGRTLTCRAHHRSWDRVVATCRRDRQTVGGLMRRAGVAEGGRGRK